ncbi:hypothetical protein [Corynebacterium ulcerans]|uniref:hypothetical protein n=1 Tax=Corynebacterium ulcerans TaxID=65058 RepID=UPI0018D71BBF|nr:hypothetical protein [Corynebacterium ulcerans]MBH5296201.1 hypothetical protein [Corynebacterium ulcerans]
MRVRVLKPFTATVNGFHRLYLPPAVVDFAAPGEFLKLGLVASEAEPEAVEDENPEPQEEGTPKVPEAEPEAVEDENPEPQEAELAKGKRPYRTSSIDKWREYAEGLGLDVKGLSREEIIAAVKAAE